MWKTPNNPAKYLFLIPIKAYKLVLSPLLPPACRYLPTCSEYAEEALKKHGVYKGSILTLKRLARCHPWGKSGYDPVPENQVFSNPSKHCC